MPTNRKKSSDKRKKLWEKEKQSTKLWQKWQNKKNTQYNVERASETNVCVYM